MYYHRRRSSAPTTVLLLITLLSWAIQDVHGSLSALGKTRVITPVSSTITRGGGGGSDGDATTERKRKLSSVDLAMAGALATMIGDAALHPVDCLKTLQQSNEGAGLSLLGAGRQIYRTSGIGGFYSGLGTYVLSDGGAGAVKFATYEYLKQWVADRVDEDYVGTALFGCAALAFVASSVVLVPGELIKQRLQMGQYDTLKQAVSSIWKTEGFFGFYTGYAGVCLRDIPYTMFELGLYDNFKALYLKMKTRRTAATGETATTTQLDEIIAAGITGGITGYLTNPLDMIKTKLMVDGVLYTGFFDCFRKTVQGGGAASLFQGGAARVAWLMPFTAIYLPVYDLLKRRMEVVPPTSSSSTALKLKGGAQVQRQQEQVQEPLRNRQYCFKKHPLHEPRAFFSF